MPTFIRGNAEIYYEEHGQGEPVIAVHGLIENNTYWDLGGVTELLSKEYRFIPMEMRGHGRTVVQGEPTGYDVDTIGEDIISLADHLGIDRFHVLTHSTGGMAAVRYAMKDSSRFASLVLADTSSFTSVVKGDAESVRTNHENFAQIFERITWEQMIASLKQMPGPFFRGLVESEQCDELLKKSLEMVKINDGPTIAAFIRSFYNDPDPMVEGLRRISCPVLVIYGEKDDLFIEISKLMAQEIPGAELREYKGHGHMVALEAPKLLSKDVLEFVKTHPL